MENTNLDAADEEEEEVSVCSAESAQMDYRIITQYLTSWDKKEVDLDTILVMTDLDLSDVTIVSHPEKYGKNAVRSLEGEVELSEDVTEGGGGMEAVSIYQYDPDKLYFLFVYKNSVALDSTFMRCGIHTSAWMNGAPMYQLDSNMEDSDNDVDDAGRLMLASLIDGGYNSGVSDRFRGYDVDAYDVADILVEKLGIEY